MLVKYPVPLRGRALGCNARMRKLMGLSAAMLMAVSGAACSEDTAASGNLIANGSFEEIEGMKEADFGYKGEIKSWVSVVPIYSEIVRAGVADMPAAEGEYWLDTGQSAASVVNISQVVAGLDAGTRLRLTFDAGQWREPSAAPDETLNVYWGEELVASVRPETVGGYERFEFDLIAGDGNGLDALRFEGISDGTKDHQGVALDNVVLSKIGDSD